MYEIYYTVIMLMLILMLHNINSTYKLQDNENLQSDHKY